MLAPSQLFHVVFFSLFSDSDCTYVCIQYNRCTMAAGQNAMRLLYVHLLVTYAKCSMVQQDYLQHVLSDYTHVVAQCVLVTHAHRNLFSIQCV